MTQVPAQKNAHVHTCTLMLSNWAVYTGYVSIVLVTTHSKPHHISKQMSVSYILHAGQELRSDFAGWFWLSVSFRQSLKLCFNGNRVSLFGGAVVAWSLNLARGSTSRPDVCCPRQPLISHYGGPLTGWMDHGEPAASYSTVSQREQMDSQCPYAPASAVAEHQTLLLTVITAGTV